MFAYTPLDLTSRYGPPDVGLDSTGTGYTYDRDRALRTIVRPDSVTVTMDYDAAGRLASVTEPRGTRVFGYDGASRLSSLTSPDGVTLSYGYDGALPLSESWSGAVSGTVELSYDGRLRPRSQQVNGDFVSLSYDGDGLLTEAGAEVLERSAENGLLTGTTLDQVTTAQSYNGAGELSTFSARHGGTVLLETSYARDSLGRITSVVETTGRTASCGRR